MDSRMLFSMRISGDSRALAPLTAAGKSRRRRQSLVAELKDGRFGDADFEKIASDAGDALRRAAKETGRVFSRTSPSLKAAMKDLQQRTDALRSKAEDLTELMLGSADQGSQNGASHGPELRLALAEKMDKVAEVLNCQVKQSALMVTRAAQDTLRKSAEIIYSMKEDVPAPIQDIAETALDAHSPTSVRRGAVMHDFCLGIPYGGGLLLGGLLWFVIAGSINALRFGAVLGAVLLAASLGSLKAWKQNKSSNPYIAVQAVIAALHFVVEVSRFSVTRAWFPTGLLAATSCLMFVFYCYVVLSGGNPPSKKLMTSTAL